MVLAEHAGSAGLQMRGLSGFIVVPRPSGSSPGAIAR